MSTAEPLPEDAADSSTSARRHREQAGLRVLEGQSGHRGMRALLPFLGPAFVASVAYVDPGNFATNISAGAQFGYTLLWVVLASNLIAMLVQYLSAKLGIATGQNLPEVIREHWPRTVTLGIWLMAEVAAMATDLAEFLGAAIGFNLLFHVPLFIAGLLTAVATFAILGLQRYGFRPVEAIITALVAVIASCYVLETFVVRPNWGQVGYHSVVPQLGSGGVLLAVGILGATVMPHVVFLHSALTQRRIVARTVSQQKRLLKYTRIDVAMAMVLAGLVNMAMLTMAAATFHLNGFTSISDLGVAYHTLSPLLGDFAGTVFGLSLLVSGLASSAVGTMAGQVIMGGFIGRTIPIWVRRGVTMLPALIVIGLDVPTTDTLVGSQVVLSFVLPFAVLPLVWFTAQRSVMGRMVNRPLTTAMAVLCALLIVVLNAFLVLQFAGM